MTPRNVPGRILSKTLWSSISEFLQPPKEFDEIVEAMSMAAGENEDTAKHHAKTKIRKSSLCPNG